MGKGKDVEEGTQKSNKEITAPTNPNAFFSHIVKPHPEVQTPKPSKPSENKPEGKNNSDDK